MWKIRLQLKKNTPENMEKNFERAAFVQLQLLVLLTLEKPLPMIKLENTINLVVKKL